MDGWMGCSRVGLEVSSMVDLEISWSTVGQDISRSPVGFVISWSRVGRAAAQKSGCHGLAPAQIPSTHSVPRGTARRCARCCPQEAPRGLPRDPRNRSIEMPRHRAARDLQEAPESSRVPPRSPNEASRQPQVAPKKPQEAPRGLPRDPRNRPRARCRGILIPEASRSRGGRGGRGVGGGGESSLNHLRPEGWWDSL